MSRLQKLRRVIEIGGSLTDTEIHWLVSRVEEAENAANSLNEKMRLARLEEFRKRLDKSK